MVVVFISETSIQRGQEVFYGRNSHPICVSTTQTQHHYTAEIEIDSTIECLADSSQPIRRNAQTGTEVTSQLMWKWNTVDFCQYLSLSSNEDRDYF